MKKSVILLILTIGISISILAEDYFVYKAKYTVRENNKQSSGEWTYDRREDQLKFTIYFVIREDYNTEGDNAPARIVTFKSSVKVDPIDTSAKTTKKLIIYPLDIVNAAGETVTVEDQYNGLTTSGADKYYIYGGLWTTVAIEASTENKSRIAMIDYYDNMTGSSTLEIENTNGKIIVEDDLKGFSEFYSGYIRRDGYAPKLDGYLNYYRTNKTAKSKKVTLRYDKRMSTKVLTGSENSMSEAVNAVVDYLVSKRYASTWSE